MLENSMDVQFLQVDYEIIDDSTHFDKFEKWVMVVLMRHSMFKNPSYPSQQTIADKVGISDRKVRDCLKSLQEKGWIFRIGVHEDTQTVKWRLQVPEAVKREWLQKKIDKLGNIEIIEEPKKDKLPTENNDSIPYAGIIEYLNDKAETNFKHTTSSTKKSINGRWKSGFTLEDFQYVIDVKTEEWKGTEYEKHLNPDTLFRPSNFEKYRNQKRKATKQPQFPNKITEKSKNSLLTEGQKMALLEEAGL